MNKNKNWNIINPWMKATLIAFVGLFCFFLLYDPSSSNRNKTPIYNLSPDQILKEYKDNEAAADKKYLGKIISIEGIVTDISSEDIRLNNDVVCNFDGKEKNKLADIRKGERITIKGECAGSLLWTVHLQLCIISQRNNENNNSLNYQNTTQRKCDICFIEFSHNNGWACYTLDTSCFKPTQTAPLEYLKYCSEKCSSIRGMQIRRKRCD